MRIDGPSVGQRSNYTWEEGLPIQFGGWSDEEIKTCIGVADADDIWLVSEDLDCPVVWPVSGMSEQSVITGLEYLDKFLQRG